MDKAEVYNQVIERFCNSLDAPDTIWMNAARMNKASSTPAVTNPIKRQGKKAQEKKEAPKRSAAETPVQNAMKERGVKEQYIHNEIVKNPFLLHTPELYAGGLYLDALINKYRLPSGHVTDFVYITVQDRIIKLTLVEIEKSAKRVFQKKINSRSRFHNAAESAVEQVRSWIRELDCEHAKKTLLRSLRALFKNYPIPIFDEEGKITKLSRLEISYLLVVGNEWPDHDSHQALIDKLYLEERIIFMTYPMMLKEVRSAPQPKNVLRVGPHSVEVKLNLVPKSLDAIVMSSYSNSTADPFGIRLAGLGLWSLFNGREDSAYNPSSLKKIFYRSKGCCEAINCERKVVEGELVRGALSPIYNVIHTDSDFASFFDVKNVALVCKQHYPLNKGNVSFAVGEQHPLKDKLSLQAPYRSDLDRECSVFAANLLTSECQRLVEVLDIDTVTQPDLALEVGFIQGALSALPRVCKGFFSKIVYEYQGGLRSIYLKCSATQMKENVVLTTLLKANLIRVTGGSPEGQQIEPRIFSGELLGHLKRVFGDRTISAVWALCHFDYQSLRRLKNKFD